MEQDAAALAASQHIASRVGRVIGTPGVDIVDAAGIPTEVGPRPFEIVASSLGYGAGRSEPVVAAPAESLNPWSVGSL